MSASESYEIVRRRLFTEVSDYPARDAVVNAFYRMYGDSKTDYPRDAAEGEYQRKMRQAYPIHPELFERLYQDWSTLERFQRTRGVLRMMASVIHRLWIDGDQSLMIMPGSIPLWNKTVQTELVRYLAGEFPRHRRHGYRRHRLEALSDRSRSARGLESSRSQPAGGAGDLHGQRAFGISTARSRRRSEVRINLATVAAGGASLAYSAMPYAA